MHAHEDNININFLLHTHRQLYAVIKIHSFSQAFYPIFISEMYTYGQAPNSLPNQKRVHNIISRQNVGRESSTLLLISLVYTW